MNLFNSFIGTGYIVHAHFLLDCTPFGAAARRGNLLARRKKEILHGHDLKSGKAKRIRRIRQDSNLRGETPIDFESIALTTRPRMPSIRWVGRQCIGYIFVCRGRKSRHIRVEEGGEGDWASLWPRRRP